MMEQGGCSDVGSTAIDNYLEDSCTLVKVAVKLMDNYHKGVAKAKRLVTVLFKPFNGNSIVAEA